MSVSENTHYTIKYNEALGLVEVIWHRRINSENFQASLILILNIIKEKQAKFFMSDARKLTPFPLEDQSWLKRYFFPELSKTGIEKFARITEQDILTQALIGNIVDFTLNEKLCNFKIQNFYERAEALDWLFLNDEILTHKKAL